jgi:hypothetical protein
MPCLTLTGAIFLPAGRAAVAGRFAAPVAVLRAEADLRGLAFGLAGAAAAASD